jgi:hypothetical protein
VFSPILELGTIASMNSKIKQLNKTLDGFWVVNSCRMSSTSEIV